MNQGHAYRERIPREAAGMTVLDHLVARWRHGTPSDWRRRLDAGEVTLEGTVARGDEPLAPDAELVWRRPPWEEPPAPLTFALLHMDEALIAVAKPAGLPTMPSGGRFLEHTLLHRVRRRWPEAAPLHRLDRGTSGVVLFARTVAARRELGIAWQRGQVRRLYRGLVEGAPEGDSFTIDAPIGELADPRIGRVFAAQPGGRAATTHFRVLERRATTTLLEIEIASGRPHQIRIHLAFAGLPLVGEPFFGAGGLPRPDPAARPGDCGYLLHAERLLFRDPLSAHGMPRMPRMEIWCAPPSKLRARSEMVPASAPP